MTNYTLIAYQEGNSYTDRCGDRYSHDGSHNIHFSTDEDEIAIHWSEYLLRDQYLEEAEQEYQITLLQNGMSEEDHEYGTDAYKDFEANTDRIKALAESKIEDRISEKKRWEEIEKKAQLAREEAQRQKAQIARDTAERAQYEALRKKFGGV